MYKRYEMYEMYEMYKMYEMNEIYKMYEMYEIYEIYEEYEIEVFGTARVSQRSQKPAIYRRSVSPLQRAPKSLHRQFNTTGT